MVPFLRPFLVLVLGCTILTACGGDGGARRHASPLDGPPAWWTAHEEARAIHVRAGAPCRITLVVEGTDEGTRVLPPRNLAAGETVRIWWAPEERAMGAAPTAEAEAGRTVGLLGGLRFGYRDSGSFSVAAPLWVRPERGQVARSDALPPPTPEALGYDREVGLAVVAVADLDAGRPLVIKPRPSGDRVRPDPADLEAPERARVLRLKLRILARDDG